MLWDREKKTCQLIEIIVPLDTNLKEASHKREIKYIPLLGELQRLHKGYKFTTVIITIGALGAVLKTLKLNLEKLNLPKERTNIVNLEDTKSCIHWNLENLQNCYENVKGDCLTEETF